MGAAKLSNVSRILLSLAAFAALSSAAWFIFKGNNLERGYEIEASKASDQAADRARVEMKRDCGSLAAPRKDKCESQIGNAYRSYRKETRDLEAQRTTALWTAYMGAAALLGMAVSIVGVGLVFITFRATREANEIARETAKQQLRAYMGIMDYSVTPMNYEGKAGPDVGSGGVLIHMQNFGQSPAIGLTTVISIGFREWGDKPEQPVKWAFEGEELPIDIQPSAPMHRTVALPEATFEHYWELPTGVVALYVQLKASYSDIFKQRHEQTTLFYSRGKRYTNGEMIVAEQSRETTTEAEE
jgi:hypothetical protein